METRILRPSVLLLFSLEFPSFLAIDSRPSIRTAFLSRISALPALNHVEVNAFLLLRAFGQRFPRAALKGGDHEEFHFNFKIRLPLKALPALNRVEVGLLRAFRRRPRKRRPGTRGKGGTPCPLVVSVEDGRYHDLGPIRNGNHGRTVDRDSVLMQDVFDLILNGFQSFSVYADVFQ